MSTTTHNVIISANMAASVTVTEDGDILKATVGRKSSLAVMANIAVEKLIARRDRARADLSVAEVDPCDGYRHPVRSLASKVEEAQCVALLRHLGVIADAVDEYTVVCVSDYASRVSGANALPAPRAEAAKILTAIATASRDESFRLLAQAEKLHNSKWVDPTWQAAAEAAAKAAAAAETRRVNDLPEDTSWGYAHGGTD
jgi:hypothetical protein